MSNPSKGAEFEKTVENLLRLMGYRVERDALVSGTQIDLIAGRDDLLQNLCLLVECTDREDPVGVGLLKEKAAVLLGLSDGRHFYRLLFVSRGGFTAPAKAFAANRSDLMLVRVEDLENHLVNFQPYVDWYLQNFEDSAGIFQEGQLHKSYVALAARDERNGLVLSLYEAVNDWLGGENNLLFLLGEYGSGKTSFCRQFVYGMLKSRYRGGRVHLPIPILIPLRDYQGASSLQQVITDTLINLYGVPLPSFLAFERLCSNGRILLVLDGFDEMASRSDRETLLHCFKQIFLLAALNAKVLLTCRSNFFRSHSDIIDLLQYFNLRVDYEESGEQRVAELGLEKQGRILSVERLGEQQIREFIGKRFPDDPEGILHTIRGIHDLADLSTRPVLLDMILKTLPEVARTKRGVNSAALYQYYTDKWTDRDTWRVFSSDRVRQSFCESLAWQFHLADVEQLDFPVLVHLIDSVVADDAQDDVVEGLRNDIQTCSFLVRSGRDDRFRFAHKSFVEFFVARLLVRRLDGGERLPQGHKRKRRASNSLWQLESLSPWDDSVGAVSLAKAWAELDRELAVSDTFRKFEFNRVERNVVLDRDAQQELERRISDVFGQTKRSEEAVRIGISEEIATFALEVLHNEVESLEPFVAGLSAEDSIEAYCDLVRLARPTDLIARESSYLRRSIRTGEHTRISVAHGAALARLPDSLDVAFMDNLRPQLEPVAWSYLVFEMANNGSQHQRALEALLELEDLSPLDSVLCFYGLRSSKPSKESLVGAELLTALVSSEDRRHVAVGLALFPSLRLQLRDFIRILTHVERNAAEGELRAEAKRLKLEALYQVEDTYISDHDYKGVRQMWAAETDPVVKAELQKVEQHVRDGISYQKTRLGWNQARTNATIRDQLWRSLRG